MNETIIYVAHHLFEIRDARENREHFDIAENEMLCVGDGVVAVQTPRAAGLVPVFVEILSAAPDEAAGRFERVTEASIEITSGKLKIEGEDNSTAFPALEIPLKNGTWVVRVLHAHEDSCSYDAEDGAEHYVVQLYHGKARKPRELRAGPHRNEPLRKANGLDVHALRAALTNNNPSERASAVVGLVRSECYDDVITAFGTDPSLAVRMAAAGALRLSRKRNVMDAATQTYQGLLNEAELALKRVKSPFESLAQGLEETAEWIATVRNDARVVLEQTSHMSGVLGTLLLPVPPPAVADRWAQLDSAVERLQVAIGGDDLDEMEAAKAHVMALIYPANEVGSGDR